VNTADFDFELPDGSIAQQPCEPRDAARMLFCPAQGQRQHETVSLLPERLQRGDLLVLNETRVIPARILTRKETGGSIEMLLLRRLPAAEQPSDEERWEALLGGSRKPATGGKLFAGSLEITVEERREERTVVRLRSKTGGGVAAAIDDVGLPPLPPYIRREAGGDPADRDRYQTVFAREPGAVAAPTAGMHLTETLLARLRDRDVGIAKLTLDVGWGTFAPVRTDQVEDHRIHSEAFRLPEETVAAVRETKARGGRVIAVGTTTLRVLEWQARKGAGLEAGAGDCRLYVYPGYEFKVVDAMLTNFHLPRSSLLFLVSAFHGRQQILEAYREAIENGYRFYSYGDATFLERR
jgi:S-adenosylmethionine:tRNA ribosyltransferase-isomerase